MASRIGVDIGGTFTDFILYSEKDNSITIDKIPTTPNEPQKAVIEVVKRNLDKVDIKEIEFFLHGTTVGLNALLERKGSKVGMLCTKGFRDVITCLDGRSDRTKLLAAQGGFRIVDTFDQMVLEADLLLSIMVPSNAKKFAIQVSHSIESTNSNLIFVDCNAISPENSRNISEIITKVGCLVMMVLCVQQIKLAQMKLVVHGVELACLVMV